MLSLLASIFGLKRSLGIGIAIAALLIALGPHLSQLMANQQAMQPAVVEQQQVASESNSQHNATEQPIIAATTENVPQQTQQNTLQDNLKALEFDKEGFNWRQDWWKYLLATLLAILILFFILKVTNLLFKTAIVTLCIVIGLVGSLLLTPFVTPLFASILEGKLPSFLAPEYLAYAVCFLVCYLIITAITNLVIHPRKKKETA